MPTVARPQDPSLLHEAPDGFDLHSKTTTRRGIKFLSIRDRVFATNCGAVFGTWPGQSAEQHRYVLWRSWGTELPLVVVGLNPSTATEEVEDNTIVRCLTYAMDWGFGSLVMLNIFSYRATKPRVLYEQRKAGALDLITGGEINDRMILWHTDPARAGLVLAGWGNHGALLDRGKSVARMLREAGRELRCLAVTDKGQPWHPLFQPRAAPHIPYSGLAA